MKNRVYIKSLTLKGLISVWVFQDMPISRLNSEILGFWSEWILNINISDFRAPKLIFIETELEPISWELNTYLFNLDKKMHKKISHAYDLPLDTKIRFPGVWICGDWAKIKKNVDFNSSNCWKCNSLHFCKCRNW